MTPRSQEATRGTAAARPSVTGTKGGRAKAPDAQRARLAGVLPESTRERVMLAVIVVLIVAGLVWYFGHGSASGGSPYADFQAHGTITFYDANGNVETHGSINTRPFVAKAVSSVPAAPPYNVTGAKATLVAYQPREGVTAPYWSGDTMTTSATYTDFSHPTAVGTTTDFSLADFLSEFPTRWGGAIEMRIYLGAPGQTTLNTTYPVADVKVTGDTWTLVPNQSYQSGS